MRVNPIMLHDNNSDTWAPPTQITCAGYLNPSAPPDYSPRDKRVWLRKCLHVDCPIERCLEMHDCTQEFDGECQQCISV